MSRKTVITCDKCNSEIKNMRDIWVGGMLYKINPNTRIRIKSQTLVAEVKFTLACGEPLDLCNECGFALLKRKAC